MKKYTLVLIAILFAVTGILAQTPNEFKYQAALRNADGTIMAEESVTIDISILQGSASGTSVFDETHSVTTTSQGLINLNIGSVEDLSVVDFSSDFYFIEISVNSTIMGTSQLLSVPYALTAKNVENDQVDDADADPTNELQDLVLNGTTLEISDGTSAELSSLLEDPTNELQDLILNGTTLEISDGTGADLSSLQDGVGDGSETIVTAGENVTVSGIGTTADPYIINAESGSATHYVGELFGGGVVFWVDETGENGLICAMVDISSMQAWSDVVHLPVPNGALSVWDGQTNSTNIIAQSANSAAGICDSYTNNDYGTGIHSDWYLPSITEQNHIWNNLYEVQKSIDIYGNGTTTIDFSIYWSSTEFSVPFLAWAFIFTTGDAEAAPKGDTRNVRAIRAF